MSKLVSLGNVSGSTVIDLSEGRYFKGDLVGSAVLQIVNVEASDTFYIDLTQANGGGHSVSFGGGADVVDPSGYLAQQFVSTAPGARSIGLWTSDGANVVALGYNATP